MAMKSAAVKSAPFLPIEVVFRFELVQRGSADLAEVPAQCLDHLVAHQENPSICSSRTPRHQEQNSREMTPSPAMTEACLEVRTTHVHLLFVSMIRQLTEAGEETEFQWSPDGGEQVVVLGAAFFRRANTIAMITSPTSQ